MIQKLYSWLDINGIKHIMVAKSLSEAKHSLLLQEQLFFKLRISAIMTKHSFSRQELIMITRQLATMLKAGLPIIDSLTLLASEHPLPQWRWLLFDIKTQIMAGVLMSQALSKHTTIFPAIYKEIIATGELTGQLDSCFDKLAHQLQTSQMLHRRIKKALRYPIFLFIVTLLIAILMLVVVLPKFAEVYQSFAAELPFFTQLIIALSTWLQNHIIQLVITLTLWILCYRYYLKKRYTQRIEKLDPRQESGQMQPL